MTPENFEKLTDSVDRIERAIVGDKSMGHRGLADRVEWIERKLINHERQILKWIGGLTLAGVLIPIAVKLIVG